MTGFSMNGRAEPAGPPLTRARRSELLAAADRGELLALAQRCLALAGPAEPIVGPEAGVVMLTVREPVESVRFHLGEVLVTRVEVAHRAEHGWAIRLGDDGPATHAAAVCDAEAAAGGPLGPEIDGLCRRTEAAADRARRDEWSALEPTIVRFEEMG